MAFDIVQLRQGFQNWPEPDGVKRMFVEMALSEAEARWNAEYHLKRAGAPHENQPAKEFSEQELLASLESEVYEPTLKEFLAFLGGG